MIRSLLQKEMVNRLMKQTQLILGIRGINNFGESQ